ncbi:hypothetical protein Ntsu_25550 [Nocardia sp. IFM 10818]
MQPAVEALCAEPVAESRETAPYAAMRMVLLSWSVRVMVDMMCTPLCELWFRPSAVRVPVELDVHTVGVATDSGLTDL